MPDFRPQEGAQSLFLSSPADIAIYGGSAGSGKAIEINTLVPTPSGWKRICDVCDQDILIDEKGNPCRVIKAHDIYIPSECYALTFDDGSTIKCCGDHLWLTYTSDDLSKLTHRDSSWKEKRRANRPSRSAGNKSALFTQRIQERNAARAKLLAETNLPLPEGSVKSTNEIVETLYVRNNTRSNHAIPVSAPWNFPEADLPIPPYTFGAHLGDGHTNGGGFTSADVEVVNEIRNDGFIVNKRKVKYVWGIIGLYRLLRINNFIGHKYIPLSYLRSSYEQRLALMQGLMDTDGYANPKGSTCEYYTSLPELADNVFELAISLGFKATKRTKRAKLNGKDYGECFTIAFSTDVPVFRLPRKLERLTSRGSRRVNSFRYIVSAEKIDPVPMRCLTVDSPSKLFLCGTSGIPTHNTVALLLEAARHVDVPGYNAVIFRREFKQVVSSGGIRDAALQIYPFIGGVYRSQPTPQFLFNPGAKISFAHLNTEAETLAWQGSEICMIGFDELSHYTYYQFEYLLSRNRSTCGVRPLVRATTNPDADSWVKDFISWWIDEETGYPIKERSGKLRYMVRIDGERKWGNSRKELSEQYGCDPLDAKSVTFVAARITDNPILLRKDPGYLANLKALSKVERARLLDGNWKIRAEAGMYFPRDDAVIIDWKPEDKQIVKWIRSWDLAASEESESRDPDWTVGILGGRKLDGKIVIADVIRLRRKADYIEQLIRNVAFQDGKDVWVCIPQDPGAAGKAIAESYNRLLSGFTILSRAITKNKVMMASSGADSPAALWQRQQIELVRAPWNKDLIDELDAFPTRGVHDDQCFVAGTMIATEFGEIPIESIIPGMYVWTRKGWRKVLAAKLTNHLASVVSIRFSDGVELTGTANHPIICKDNSIVKLQDLSDCDNLVWLDFVRDRVLEGKTIQENLTRVYNLSVEGENEYFANGILVHNCDALSALVRNLPGHAKPDYSQSGLSGKFKPYRVVQRVKSV